MSKIQVAVLGATGMIGQRFIQMLEDHPYFEIEGLYNGKKLSEVLKVRDHVYLDETMDRKIETMDISKISKECPRTSPGPPRPSSPKPAWRCSPTQAPTGWTRASRS